ncbi:Ca(2+)-dependent cysteine protease [Haplosporangium sp. Z 27]|nr:Ca(2+)-dependent cysteine protease [Haplosporangium sp. Z 27]
MYPGQYRPPQQHYAPPPGQPPAPGYYPQPYGAPPPGPGYAPYPPPQGQPHYAPPGPPPPGHYPPPAYAPSASSPYPPPASSPYPQPASSPYPPPASSPYPPPASSPYPPPTSSPYAPPASHSHYAAPAYPPPAAIPQQMIAPANVPPPPQGWAMYQKPNVPPPIPFQLSNCQGRKRALFIGINYFGQRNELRGCINDTRNIKAFIIRQYGFREEDTISLTDDQKDPTRIPTKANILAAMQWLVRDARPNDSFFFHYSGHGGQTKDLDGDEEDGYDNTIYPVDHERSDVIIDDIMHDIMVRPLPPGCRLTAIMDCCHSGSALDLPYTYSTAGHVKEGNVLAGVGSGVMNAGMSYLRGDIGGAIGSFTGIGKRIMNPTNRDEIIRRKASPADCIMFSGCKDSQTSADTQEQGFGMTGAMTFSFITALTANPRQSYLQLLNTIRDILRTKYEQKPQLSSSHPLDLNLLFTM